MIMNALYTFVVDVVDVVAYIYAYARTHTHGKFCENFYHIYHTLKIPHHSIPIGTIFNNLLTNTTTTRYHRLPHFFLSKSILC